MAGVQNEKIEFDEFHIKGEVHPYYKKVADIFRQNFENDLEHAGASFAVYYKNELLINIYGGYRNVNEMLPWENETMSVCFSTTKSISSVILAYILDKYHISYDTKIISFWPEFGSNGKEEITILDATLHQAGLAYFNEKLTREDILDHEKISKMFENATPMIEKGNIIYHALTFGLLLEQIIRRIDEKKRSIAQILDEDFIAKYDIKDLSIGLKNRKDNEKVAILTKLDEKMVQKQAERNPKAYELYMSGDNIHHQKLYEIFSWITTDDYNLIENRLLPMPSNMGISSAKALAKFHSLLSTKRILSTQFYKLFEKPVLENAFDHGIGYTESKGYGFQFTKNPLNQWVFGHSGFGGQNVRVDMHNELTFAYISNGLKIEDADMVLPWNNLVKEVYNIFERVPNYEI
ncbi:unnamed protein product [Caenorhabditis bovis]|uniref:Beta-lactamase-related domain-containing protein n=1 Tax=Caenorhabditis bovis TaxID=2654633 RepID=A0A8S1EII5_9PELO|nr:unnamed protein product [Caenorhabditis bovis]